MGPRSAGLSGADVTVLVQKILDPEPGVFSRAGASGRVFFVRGPLGGLERGPRLFAIAAEGGVLLRVAPDELEDILEQPDVVRNLALPEWVLTVAREVGAEQARPLGFVQGDPSEWVWLRLEKDATFSRRRHLVLDALAYARHQVETDERARSSAT